jgi:hypothetical protein
MNLEPLRATSSAQPFRPVVIDQADGREIPHNHRELIRTVPSGRTGVVTQADTS